MYVYGITLILYSQPTIINVHRKNVESTFVLYNTLYYELKNDVGQAKVNFDQN